MGPGTPTPLNRLARCRPALGTYVKISLCGDDEGELLGHSQAAFAEIERVERLMSFHDPASELSRLNREAHLRPVTVSRETAEVLRFGLRLSRLSDGAFDFTVAPELVRRGHLPDHGQAADPRATWRDVHLEGGRVRFGRPLLVDLGGIAKGYAVDRAMAVVPSRLEAVVNAGGDLRMRPWRGRTVAVQVPRRRRRSLRQIVMRAGAVATSGSYLGEEGSPIFCPRRRQPIETRCSASVFATSCLHADALTKVAFSLSSDHPLWRDLCAVPVLVDSQGRGGEGLRHG